MTKKKVYDLEVRQELKTTKDIMNLAVEDLANTTMSREEFIAENNELKSKIKHLEELLKNSEQVSDITIKSHEEEIIRVELRRMYEAHVLQDIPMIDKDDIKKLKTLIESLAIIKTGQKVKKPKVKEMSVEAALAMVADEVNK